MARTVDYDYQGVWRSRLRRFETCGLTVTKFCDDEEISVASFYHWRKRLAAQQADSRLRPACVQVSATPTAKKDSVPSLPFVPVQVRPTAVAAIEIHLPNGARVCLPGGDAELLRVAIESAARAYGAIVSEAGTC